MILPSANREEQIHPQFPTAITEPSCTIWSWKSFGTDYTFFAGPGSQGGEGCVCLAHQGRSVLISSIHTLPLKPKRPHLMLSRTLKDLGFWGIFL